MPIESPYITDADLDAYVAAEQAAKEQVEDKAVEQAIEVATLSPEQREALTALGFNVDPEAPSPEPVTPAEEPQIPAGLASVRQVQEALGVDATGTWDVRSQRAWERTVAAAEIPGRHARGIAEDWYTHAITAGFEPTPEGMLAVIEQARKVREATEAHDPVVWEDKPVRRPPARAEPRPEPQKPKRRRRKRKPNNAE